MAGLVGSCWWEDGSGGGCGRWWGGGWARAAWWAYGGVGSRRGGGCVGDRRRRRRRRRQWRWRRWRRWVPPGCGQAGLWAGWGARWWWGGVGGDCGVGKRAEYSGGWRGCADVVRGGKGGEGAVGARGYPPVRWRPVAAAAAPTRLPRSGRGMGGLGARRGGAALSPTFQRAAALEADAPRAHGGGGGQGRGRGRSRGNEKRIK